MPKKMCRVCRKRYDKYNMYVTTKGYTCEFCLIKYGMKPTTKFHLLAKKYGKRQKL